VEVQEVEEKEQQQHQQQEAAHRATGWTLRATSMR